MRSRYVYTLLAAGLALATRSAEVSGHEGHDHGAPAASISVAAMPRAEAASDLFELVAVSRGGELILYVDRFASNEPVSGAEIQIETPAGSIEARARPDGTYVVAAPWSATPGRYDLIFTVSENATADVLPVSLEIPSGVSGNQTPGPSFITTAFANGIKERLARNDPAIVVAVLGGFLAGLLVMALLSRRRNRAHASLPIVLLFIALATSGGSSTWAHESEDHGEGPAAPASASRDTAQRLPDGSVFVPKSTQRILAIRTVVTEPAVHRRARSSCRAASSRTRTQAGMSRLRLVGGSRRRRRVPPARNAA